MSLNSILCREFFLIKSLSSDRRVAKVNLVHSNAARKPPVAQVFTTVNINSLNTDTARKCLCPPIGGTRNKLGARFIEPPVSM